MEDVNINTTDNCTIPIARNQSMESVNATIEEEVRLFFDLFCYSINRTSTIQLP